MTSETVDVYDDEYRITGHMERDLAHSVGALHKTMQCWFVDEAHVYFQIRGRDAGFPGLLDVTVGGHVAIGESDEAALRREAMEEVGVNLRSLKLNHIGRSVFTYDEGKAHVREFSEVFMLPAERSFSTFSPNPREVTGIAAIPFAEGRQLIDCRLPSLQIRASVVNSHGSVEEWRTLTSDAFIPGMSRYFSRVLQVAELFSSGSEEVSL